MVSVTTTPTVQFGEPVSIYDGMVAFSELNARPFDVMPDGQRFLVIQEDPFAPAERPELSLVLNWIEELRARFEDRH